MNEITKLYENAGIEPEWQDCCKIADKYWAYETESGFEYLMQKECPYNQECTNECEYAYDKVVYPPFTAEKQLNIIKLISKQGQIIIENWEEDNRGFNVTFRANSNLRYITMDCITRKTVEEAIAQIINDIWQDLTEEERKQIKNILESEVRE